MKEIKRHAKDVKQVYDEMRSQMFVFYDGEYETDEDILEELMTCDDEVWERYKEDYAPTEPKTSGKNGLYNYIWEHFTLDAGACGRIVENLIDYVDHKHTEYGELTPEGMYILETVIADALGMDKSEIIENWG